jgi:hypothetical protein
MYIYAILPDAYELLVPVRVRARGDDWSLTCEWSLPIFFILYSCEISQARMIDWCV